MRGLLLAALATGCFTTSPRQRGADGGGGGPGADGAGGGAGGVVEVLATDQPGPIGIAVDDDTVYWNNIGDDGWSAGAGSVVKIAKAGGSPAVLAEGEEALDLALDEEFVYWARGRSNAVAHGAAIMKVAKAGGTPTVVAWELQETQTLAVDDTHVYLNNGLMASGSLDRMTKTGTDVTTLVPDDANGPMDIVMDAGTVYFANGNTGEVRAWNKVSAEVTRVTFGFTGAGTLAIGPEGRLYFSACDDPACNMGVFTVEGDETDYQTVARVTGQIRGLEWDGSRLYAASWQRIVAIDPVTGEVATLVELEEAASALAVDAEYVYWADYTARTISRTHK
jgi:hypothetical protein